MFSENDTLLKMKCQFVLLQSSSERHDESGYANVRKHVGYVNEIFLGHEIKLY